MSIVQVELDQVAGPGEDSTVDQALKLYGLAFKEDGSRKTLDELLDDLMDGGTLYASVDDEGEPLGVISTFPDGGLMRLGGIGVNPEYRSQGIGDELVKFALNKAREDHLSRVALNAVDSSVAFAQHFGFYPVASRGSTTLMELEI